MTDRIIPQAGEQVRVTSLPPGHGAYQLRLAVGDEGLVRGPMADDLVAVTFHSGTIVLAPEHYEMVGRG